MQQGDGYWIGRRRVLYTRRRLMHGAALAAGNLAATALACGSRGPAGSSQGAGGVSVGRSATQSAGETPQMGGTVTWFDGANPPTLDPQATSSVTTMQAVGFSLSRLLRFKSVQDVQASYNLDTEPDLATSVETPDGITWTVKLRPNAKFHNIPPVSGHAVEAEDIKASFTRGLTPKNPNSASLGMMDPAQIETPDKTTVVFKLRYPYAPFVKLMASGVYSWILPREALAGSYDPAKTVIGSGPFTFESFTPDVAYVYRKNPEWWQPGQPYVDGVRRAIIPDAAQRLAQFTSGNLHLLTSVPASDLATAKQQNPKADAIMLWDAGGPMTYFQLGDPASPFQDIRLRRAVSMAIDRAAFGKSLLNNQFEPSFNVPLSLGKWALKLGDLSPDTQQWYKLDLAQAKKLMDAAGGSSLSVKMLDATPHPRDPYFKQAAETFSSMLSALPWKITLVYIDYNKDWVGGGKGARYGNFPPDSLVMTGLEGRTDVDEYLYGWWHSKSNASISRLKDATLDAMIDKARTTLDENERVKSYIDVQKYMADKTYTAGGNPSGYNPTMVQPSLRNYTVGDNYGQGTSAFSKVWLAK
jgi:peptide/nickel transport system substrate-binding protein